jgi:predicted RNase H-like HicB family nuclease
MPQVDQIRIRAEVFQEGDQYVAICPELNVSSFADTPQDAVRSLREAVSLFLEECHRMGTLRQVLEEAGFSHTTTPNHQWVPPKPVGTEQLSLSVAHA